MTYQDLPPPPHREKINIDKVLDIISNSQQVVLSKNLTETQTSIILDSCHSLIEFVELDHYTQPHLYKSLVGDKNEVL